MKTQKDITIQITTGTIVRVIAVSVFAWLLWYLRDLVLILLTAIVIASAVRPGANKFVKLGIPRVFSVLLIYIITLGVFASVIYAFVPPLLYETSGLLADIPSLVDVIEKSKDTLGFVPESIDLANVVGTVNKFIIDFSHNTFAVVSNIFGGLLTFLLILIFSFYFSVQERGIENMIRIIVPKRSEKYAINLWKRSQKKIGFWMQGQLLLGVIIAALTFLGLAIMGVKYALLLAVLAGLFELIPVFGPILAAVPAIAIAFVTGDLSLALMVAMFYVIIQQFENHLIYPLVVTKVVGVPPMVVIISLIVGAQVAGFLGILLSVPLAAVLQEVVNDFDKYKHGELFT